MLSASSTRRVAEAIAKELSLLRFDGHPPSGVHPRKDVNAYPFIEAEKSQGHNVKRACELLKVSRSAYCAARPDGMHEGESAR